MVQGCDCKFNRKDCFGVCSKQFGDSCFSRLLHQEGSSRFSTQDFVEKFTRRNCEICVFRSHALQSRRAMPILTT